MGQRILLVEDEPELLQALSVRLTASGFECRLAANGLEALAIAQAWAPQLVIADLVMPEMDGYTLVQRLRQDPATAPIPIMVLTAVPAFARESRQELRGVHVIQKPFDSEQLLLTARRLLGQNASSGGLSHG